MTDPNSLTANSLISYIEQPKPLFLIPYKSTGDLTPSSLSQITIAQFACKLFKGDDIDSILAVPKYLAKVGLLWLLECESDH